MNHSDKPAISSIPFINPPVPSMASSSGGRRCVLQSGGCHCHGREGPGVARENEDGLPVVALNTVVGIDIWKNCKFGKMEKYMENITGIDW